MKIEEYKLLDKRYKDNLDGSEKRWEKMVDFYYRGVKDKENVLRELSVVFPSKYQDEIILSKVEAEGLCPHHFLPTHYTAEIGYKPSGDKVVGTSKAYMAFKLIAAQPLLMEDIFDEFFDEFWNRVKPLEMRMEMRGKYECNLKDGVLRSAEVVLHRERKK
jgi:GTP cyclohydrolase I